MQQFGGLEKAANGLYLPKEYVQETQKPIMVLIIGGSGCGKTTYAHWLSSYVGKSNVTIISLDDYYKNQGNIPFEERLKVNYDNPNSLDWNLYLKQLIRFCSDLSNEVPIYDFTHHTRSDKTKLIVPTKIMMFEGIFGLYNKPCNRLFDLRIFLNAPKELRLERRIYRDMRKRGRTRESVIEMWNNNVQPMYEMYIKHTQKRAMYFYFENEKRKSMPVMQKRIEEIAQSRGIILTK